MFSSECALADENGISFWVPGFFGSFAATPQQPGWSLANIYYHTSVSAGADVARAREFSLGRVPANLTVNANLNLSVNATGNLGFVIPTYVFETPVLGGQASVSLIAAYGVVGTSLAGTLSGVLTGPFGNSVPFARSDAISDTTWGFGDLIPQFSLRWNAGVHNYMTYITGDIPVGAYQSSRLSNLGIGHGAIDGGGGCYLFQSADRPRILWRAWLHLQYSRTQRRNIKAASICTSTGVHRSSCRSRSWLASWAMSTRSSAATAVRRPCRLLPVPGGWRRSPDRIPFSGRRHAGLSQLQGLRRIRCGKPAIRLERLGDLCHLAAHAWSASDYKASYQKILASIKLLLFCRYEGDSASLL